MITAVLEFIHARKWIVELILVLAVVGGVWWFCNHLIEKGVQQQKDADAIATAQLTIDAAKETGRLQAIADTAEHAHDDELKDLRDYRDANPLHGGLCNNGRQGNLPSTSTAQPINANTGASAELVQQMPVGNSEPRRQPEPDIRHMLDLLAGRGDQVSAELREYQARNR